MVVVVVAVVAVVVIGGDIWGASGSSLGSIWDWDGFGNHLGVIWESFGNHLGVILTSFGCHLGARSPRKPQDTPGDPGLENRCPSQLKCKSSIKMSILQCVFEGQITKYCKLQAKMLRGS